MIANACKVRFVALLCIWLLSTFSVGSGAQTEVNTDNFTVWKHGNFYRFMVNKTTDFRQYKKVLFFPLNHSEFKIADKTKKRLKRSWEDFGKDEMPRISEKFLELAKSEIHQGDHFESTDEGGEGVLVVEFRAIELLPRVFRDNSLSTVGSETFENVGVLQYRIVMVDSKTRQLVAMVDDDLPINLPRKALNTRANQNRAWNLSFEYILKQFDTTLADLVTLNPKDLK